MKIPASLFFWGGGGTQTTNRIKGTDEGIKISLHSKINCHLVRAAELVEPAIEDANHVRDPVVGRFGVGLSRIQQEFPIRLRQT